MVEEQEMMFVYSEMQIDEEKKICKKIGKIFECGSVAMGHSNQQFTKIISKDELSPMCAQYPDTVVVTQGKLSNMKYTDVKREYIR